MRIVFYLFIFCLLNFSLIKSDDDDDENTDDDNPTTISDKKTNAPIIQSSSSKIYFEEQFQDKSKWSLWVKSQATKDGVEESIARYDGEWAFEIPKSSVYTDDYGLVLKSKARHHAITVNLNKPFDFSTSPLIVQYEVKFQTNQECGGAYVKLLSNDGKPLNLEQVTDKTPYTIMFGPDMCGNEHKYHFIIRYRNPKTGLYTEHQAKKPTESLDTYFTDQKSHLYTLVLSADNSFTMHIDNKLINSGDLLRDMEPSIIPPKEIVDETDRKPDDWDDQEKIVDTNAKKPNDWDETAPREIIDKAATIPKGWLENEALMVPDPEAVKPEDWDDEIDGTWEAPSVDNPLCQAAPGCGKWTPPMITNPAYKGPWSAPLIDNPKYRGTWEPRKIPNPDCFDEAHPYKLSPIGSLALELWSMVDGVVFDNFLITSDQSIAKQYADQIWHRKSVLEEKATPPPPPSDTTTTSSSSSESVIDTIINLTKQRPWLWGVFGLVLVLPLLILYVFCWPSKSTTKKSVDGLKKKTDDDEEVEESNVEQKQTKRTVESKATGKDALENDDEKDSSPSADNKARRRTRKE